MRLTLVVVLVAASAGSAMAEGRTIQIEPRPTYGATVSIEAGVRVYRPLPAGPRTVIVNPSRTPLVIDVDGGTNVNNQTTSTSNVVINRRRY